MNPKHQISLILSMAVMGVTAFSQVTQTTPWNQMKEVSPGNLQEKHSISENTGTPAGASLAQAPEVNMQIEVVASPIQIGAYTGSIANPWGAAFDSMGRFIFFDQRDPLALPSEIGSNQLIRMTTSGGVPTFETIATEADLAAVDSLWAATEPPALHSLDCLADDSIVLLSTEFGTLNFSILHVVPGPPPTITTITAMDLSEVVPGSFYITNICVDRSTTPDQIFIGEGASILTIDADVVNGTPSIWYSSMGSYGIQLDLNGDLLYASYSDIYRVDRASPFSDSPLSDPLNDLSVSLDDYFDLVRSFAVDPTTGNILASYSYSGSGPDEYTSHYNLLQMKPGIPYYTSDFYLLGAQVLEDPDVQPYVNPAVEFILPGDGIAIDPSGQWIYCSNGTPPNVYLPAALFGTNSIIRIGTPQSTGLDASKWSSMR